MSSASLRASILLLAFVAVFSGVAAKPPFLHGPSESETHCLTELGLTETELRDRFRNGENDKEDCFGACVLKQKGVLTSSGEIDVSKAIEDLPPFVPKDEARIGIDKCAADSKGKTDCETAANFHKCMRKDHPHMGKDPEFQRVFNACKAENNLSNDDLKRPTSDDKEDCFAVCIAKGLGFLKADGTLDGDKVLEKRPPHVDEETLKTTIAACENMAGANPCETVVLLRNCFHSKSVFLHGLGGPKRKHSHDA